MESFGKTTPSGAGNSKKVVKACCILHNMTLECAEENDPICENAEEMISSQTDMTALEFKEYFNRCPVPWQNTYIDR